MKTSHRILSNAAIALAISFALAGCNKPESSDAHDHAQAAASESHDAHVEHSHEHHEHPGSVPELPEGELWPTDAPLRAAMDRIASAVEERQPAFDAGTLTAADAQALSEQIESDVHYMIENCKLPPEPDAVLHALIARLLSGAHAMKADPSTATGLPELAAVVNDYQATFDHTDAGATG